MVYTPLTAKKYWQLLSANLNKMIKCTQIIRWQQPTNFLSEFYHFMGLALAEYCISFLPKHVLHSIALSLSYTLKKHQKVSEFLMFFFRNRKEKLIWNGCVQLNSILPAIFNRTISWELTYYKSFRFLVNSMDGKFPVNSISGNPIRVNHRYQILLLIWSELEWIK